MAAWRAAARSADNPALADSMAAEAVDSTAAEAADSTAAEAAEAEGRSIEVTKP
jgi:hypothetical protein